jgi:hypothetical protein
LSFGLFDHHTLASEILYFFADKQLLDCLLQFASMHIKHVDAENQGICMAQVCLASMFLL